MKTASATNMKRFKFYSIYAWLGSSIMTISTLVASFGLNESHPLFVNIGKNKCFIVAHGIKHDGIECCCRQAYIMQNMIYNPVSIYSPECILLWTSVGFNTPEFRVVHHHSEENHSHPTHIKGGVKNRKHKHKHRETLQQEQVN